MLTQICHASVTIPGEPESQDGEKSQPARKLKRRRPSRARLPWFHCRKCGSRLAMMDVVDGRTCVRIGPYAVSYKITIVCERCGEDREFISMQYG